MGNIVPMKLESKNLVTQSNKLIEARYSLSVYEQRLVLMMISMIEPQDDDFKNYVIKVSDFIDLLGLKGGSAYNRIKTILRGLRKKELLIEDGKDYLVTGWVSSAIYKSNRGEIFISFDKNLKPFLLSLKKEFVSQRLNTIIKFKSIYTIRVYALLKQYEKIGSRDFQLIALKEMLGLKNNQYPIFSNFKARVLIPAQKELSGKDNNGVFKSDLGFELEAIKTGRKITGLKFIIIRQDTSTLLLDDKPNSKSLDMLLSYSIGKSKANDLARNHSEKEIIKCIEIFENKKAQGYVKNGGVGLLIKLIEDGAGLKTQTETKKEEAEQLRIKLEQQKRHEKLIEDLNREFSKKAKSDFIKSLSEKEYQSLFEEALQENECSPLLKFIEKDGLKATILGAFLIKKIPNYEENRNRYISENTPTL